MLRAALVKAGLQAECSRVHDGEPAAKKSVVSSKLARTLATLGSVVALGASLSCALTGCVVSDRHDYTSGSSSSGGDPSVLPPSNNPPIAVHVDTSQMLVTKPGEGVGIFVEYDGNGQWKLWTTCDTNKSGVSCGFDLYVTADQLHLASLDNTESTDFVDVSGSAAHASFDTASDTDGVTFTATPGAYLEVEVYLDGQSAEQYVYWVGDGKVHEGAASNPIDFWPN